ncbi:Transcriptional regulatory protein ZraR [Planctomycetes bacterium K2D]|uniref:Transcriptional regulatory protein ZraR n=2 Tax=Botrimarina mediterranea TaxID=2528022 RepID=A0A518KCN8_9BACT|nr:Transcriptional regulatory protein ZraR [Botrimarina mediterranea]QDV80195.1 Transcriptional regulatory protein ZraR [Planctomycetes bacterium K2D]
MGTRFPLAPRGDTLLGRGGACQVALPDPICSRVHARIVAEEERWVVADNKSRNGTYVNGQKVGKATLGDGHVIRIGTTELEFHESEEPATAEDATFDGMAPAPTQTIVDERHVTSGGVDEASLDGLPNTEQVKELMLLYQLCIKLLGSSSPDELVQTALDLLKARTGASVVGFLWPSDEGELRAKHSLPSDASSRLALSPSLTELVIRAGNAVWVANQEAPSVDSSGTIKIGAFADAICAPLLPKLGLEKRDNVRPLGALHAYLEDGRFRQSDFDFIISVANLLAVSLARAMEWRSLRQNFDRLVAAAPGYDGLIGESEPMLELKAKIARVATARGSVLIRGESGAGKELVARAIHRASARVDRPMVSVNCAAIPHDLMESQLFGHKAGSFTGADRDHSGFFQQADMGTLFLDEVGEMTPAGQAKLLRVLEGHPFLPVGATQPVTVDVRVLAATNQDLQNYVRDGKFREDLYYRLSVFELRLPPLRERGEDISLLVDFFFDHFKSEHGRPGIQLSPSARERLLGYHWPGNVRQLRNVIDSAVVMAIGQQIEPEDLALRDAGTSAKSAGQIESLRIDEWEKKLILEALARTKGVIPEAAKLLGIGRATLYRKVDQYGIDR